MYFHRSSIISQFNTWVITTLNPSITFKVTQLQEFLLGLRFFLSFKSCNGYYYCNDISDHQCADFDELWLQYNVEVVVHFLFVWRLFRNWFISNCNNPDFNRVKKMTRTHYRVTAIYYQHFSNFQLFMSIDISKLLVSIWKASRISWTFAVLRHLKWE